MSRHLLDTHAFLWFIMGDEALGVEARQAIESPGAENLVSIASIWEAGLKNSLGKLPLVRPFQDLIPEQLRLNGFTVLPVAFEHIVTMMTLPWHHRDPFDRLLLAQALHEDLTLLSCDRYFDAYGVRLLWD